MTPVDPIVDGKYLRAESQQQAFAAAEAVSPLNLKNPAPTAVPAPLPADG